MKRTIALIAVLSSLGLFPALSASADSPFPTPDSESSPPESAVKVQLRYQDLLLRIRNVKYVMTASCEEASGALITNLTFTPPLIDCIAVRVTNASDLLAIESVYDNPLMIQGILIHFTSEDPFPSKGGITVHN